MSSPERPNSLGSESSSRSVGDTFPLSHSNTNETLVNQRDDNNPFFTTVEMERDMPIKDMTEIIPHNTYAPSRPSPLIINDDKWSTTNSFSSKNLLQEEEDDDPASKKHYEKRLSVDKALLKGVEGTDIDATDESDADIDDDKDHDFDWNDDPASNGRGEKTGGSLKRNTTVKKIRAAYNRYCCWHYLSNFMRRVIIALIGSSVFVAVGVCVYMYIPKPSQAQMDDPNFANVRANVQLWMYWAAFMWHIAWITTFIIEAVPILVSKWIKLFRGRISERIKSYMEYFMSLKLYLKITIISAWNWGTWAFFITIPFSSTQNQSYTTTIWRVCACIFVASIYLLCQKTIVQVIATRFHRFAFKDRVNENRRAVKVLDRLGKAEYRRSNRASGFLRNRKNRPNPPTRTHSTDSIETAGQSTSIASSMHSFAAPSSAHVEREPYSRQTSSSADLLHSFKKNLKKAVINEKPHETRNYRKNLDINSDEFAKKTAKKLYHSLAYPSGYLPSDNDGRRCLVLADFEPYFKTAEESKKAFEIFDRDGNGDITRREFRDTVVQIYRDRKDIAISMRDTSQVLGKVDHMLLGVSLIAILFTCFAIFDVEVWRSLVPLGSILLALSFVFSNTAKNTFESILFLFVTHPYDAGDYVLIDDTFLLVHNLGVMGTTFVSGEGQTIYAPTTVLMTKLITNVRRSGSMGETVKINISFHTTSEQFWELSDRLSAWINSQSRDFGAGFDVRIADIIDINQLIVNIWLPHKGNWQELGKRFTRKTRFMLALKDILTELEIKYELPPQRITQDVGEEPVFGPNGVLEESKGKVQNFGRHMTPSEIPSRVVDPGALDAIRKERAHRGRYNAEYSGSANASGDGGW